MYNNVAPVNLTFVFVYAYKIQFDGGKFMTHLHVMTIYTELYQKKIPFSIATLARWKLKFFYRDNFS